MDGDGAGRARKQKDATWVARRFSKERIEQQNSDHEHNDLGANVEAFAYLQIALDSGPIVVKLARHATPGTRRQAGWYPTQVTNPPTPSGAFRRPAAPGCL